MEGTIIARAERNKKESNYKKILIITAIVAAVIMLIGMISSIADASKYFSAHEHSRYCYDYYYRSDYYNDLENGGLVDYKMDCAYTGSAFSKGMSDYFAGGFFFPFLLAIGGVCYALIDRAKAKGLVISVSEEAVIIAYDGGKTVELPLCSVFSVAKVGEGDLNIVTSENNYTLRNLDKGREEVYAAILQRIPDLKVKSPANNEQVLAKGYPPAIKPVLLVLLILIALVTIIAAIASQFPAVLFIGAIPFVIVLVFYLLAKTPYFVVTDKRVFFVGDFGRKLSLPINKITVVVTHSWFKQLHIAAPTGRIHLFWIKNTAELYDVINALLNEKQ